MEQTDTDLLRSFGPSFFTGPTFFGQALDQTGSLRLFNASSVFGTFLQAGNATAEITYTFPTAGPANANSLIQSSTTGVFSFVRPPGTGTTTNDNAPVGGIGETQSSAITSTTNFPTSGQYGDLTSISLTAGDWLISVLLCATANGATVTQIDFGIGTSSGNSSTGLVEGDNESFFAGFPTALTDVGSSIPSWRASIASTTIYYLKYKASYSVAVPKAIGRITAVRIR